MESSLDPASRATLKAVRAGGYAVEFKQARRTFHVTATYRDGGTRAVAGNDLCLILHSLAECAGIEIGEANAGAT